MEMQVIGRSCRERPKYKATAAELLERAREFYRDPENEKAYQQWLADRKETK